MTVPCSNPADMLAGTRKQALFLCCAGMGYESLKATFYFAFWKRPYGLVKDIAPAIEIDSRHTTDIVL
jgi:hypothetical protein